MTSTELRILNLSPHFKYYELFPKWLCEEMSVMYLQTLIDPRIMATLEEVRKNLGPVEVNTWYWGGQMQWRGFRTPGSRYYSPGSAHSFGQAVDFNVQGLTTSEVHEHILNNEEKYMQLGLSRLEHLEDAPTWVHADVKFTGLPEIHVFRA